MRPTSGKGCLRAALLSAAIAVGAIAPTLNPSRTEADVSGNWPWSVVMCKFSDHPTLPSPPSGSGFSNARDYLQALFTDSGKGTGGLYDYWHDVSYGQLDLTGSKVADNSYTLPYTLDQAYIINGDSPPISPVATAEPGTTVQVLPDGTVVSASGVDPGSHRYAVSFVTRYTDIHGTLRDGEGMLSPITPAKAPFAAVTTSEGEQVYLSAIPTSPRPSVVARRIYRTKAGTEGPFYLVDTVDDNTTTTYTDTLPDSALGAASPGRTRDTVPRDCVALAKDDVSFPDYRGIAVFFGSRFDTWGASDRTFTLPDLHAGIAVTKNYGMMVFDELTWHPNAVGHEMGHGYGLDHSYDAALTRCTDGGAPGEYCDPWDIMGGVGGPSSYFAPSYEWSGPGLNAPNLLKLGWVPESRIYTFGSTSTATITLPALNDPRALASPAAGTYLVARVPLDSPVHYYTVEFRRKAGWDQAIPQDTVLIHEVRDGRSYLVDPGGLTNAQWLAGMSMEDTVNHLRIKVDSIAPPAPDPDSVTLSTIPVATVSIALVPTSSGDGSSVPCGSPGGPICYSPDGPPAP